MNTKSNFYLDSDESSSDDSDAEFGAECSVDGVVETPRTRRKLISVRRLKDRNRKKFK